MEIFEETDIIDEKSLLLSIWTKPTLTLEYILKNCPNKYLNALIIGIGLSSAVYTSPLAVLGHGAYSILIVAFVIIVSWILYWVVSYLASVLLSWTGGLIKGRADMDRFLTILPWSCVPYISVVFLSIPEMLLFGDHGWIVMVLYYLIRAAQFALYAWSLIILVKGIMLVQKFTAGKAILNLFLATVLFYAIAFIIWGIWYVIH